MKTRLTDRQLYRLATLFVVGVMIACAVGVASLMGKL